MCVPFLRHSPPCFSLRNILISPRSLWPHISVSSWKNEQSMQSCIQKWATWILPRYFPKSIRNSQKRKRWVRYIYLGPWNAFVGFHKFTHLHTSGRQHHYSEWFQQKPYIWKKNPFLVGKHDTVSFPFSPGFCRKTLRSIAFVFENIPCWGVNKPGQHYESQLNA